MSSTFQLYLDQTLKVISHYLFMLLQSQMAILLFQFLFAVSSFWHGGGFARAAHWIRRPRVAGGRACVNRVTSSGQFLLVKSFFNGPRGSAARAQMPAAGIGGQRLSFTFSAQVGHLSPSSVILAPTCCEKLSNLAPRSPKRAEPVKIAEIFFQELPTRQDPKM